MTDRRFQNRRKNRIVQSETRRVVPKLINLDSSEEEFEKPICPSEFFSTPDKFVLQPKYELASFDEVEKNYFENDADMDLFEFDDEGDPENEIVDVLVQNDKEFREDDIIFGEDIEALESDDEYVNEKKVSDLIASRRQKRQDDSSNFISLHSTKNNAYVTHFDDETINFVDAIDNDFETSIQKGVMENLEVEENLQQEVVNFGTKTDFNLDPGDFERRLLRFSEFEDNFLDLVEKNLVNESFVGNKKLDLLRREIEENEKEEVEIRIKLERAKEKLANLEEKRRLGNCREEGESLHKSPTLESVT